MKRPPGRVFLPALLLATWFITVVGGWGDVARAIAGESHQPPDRRAVELLSGTALPGADELGMPTRVEVAGDELLVLDRYRTEAMIALDRRSGRLLRSFGREGDGPGEFRSPVAFTPVEGGVAVLDVGLNRVTWLASEPGEYTLRGTTLLETEAPATDLVLIPGGELFVMGFLGSGRLARLSRGGSFIGYEGESAMTAELPPERAIEALQGALRASPDGRRLVRTSRFASRVEITDIESSDRIETWGPERFEPWSGGDYETRFGYLDAAPRRDGFLALYSGRTRAEDPDRANYGAMIHEFDWEGRLRAEHRLDADVIAIAWSEEDRLLYAVRHEPVPSIMVYSLE